MYRRHFRFLIGNSAFVLALVAVCTVFGFEQPTSTPLRQLATRHADLYIGNVYYSATSKDVPIPQSAQSGLSELGVVPDGAYFDVRSGRWATLMPNVPLIPGNGVANRLQWPVGIRPAGREDLGDAAWNSFVRYLEQHSSALTVEPAEVTRGKVTVHRGGQLIQIYAPRVFRGIPVRDSFVNATISHGNLILLGFNRWGDIETQAIELVGQAAAERTARTYLGNQANDATWGKPELVYLPTSAGEHVGIAPGAGYFYRLVWVLRPHWETEFGEWELLVDAHSGEILAFEDKANYADTREVIGGVYPVSNDGVGADGTEQSYPIPFADIDDGDGDLVTDGGGNAYCIEGDITTTFQGPYVTISDTCGEVSETTSGAILDFGMSGGTDCTVPPGGSAGNTHASRSGFYEVNKIAEIGRSHLPDNTFLNSALLVEMNILDTCNATSSAAGLRFFRSGGGCANTGEIAGVFDHEWGHSMDRSDANPTISSPGEGIADIYASLRLNTSCIGRNFRPGVPCAGFGDPCVSCTGVRDIDFSKRVSGVPHDLAWTDANCGSGGSTPCGGSTHCEGAVYAEAVYKLYTSDLQSLYGMSLDTAREVTTQLTFQGAGAVGSWYSCVDGAGTGDGCNADGGYLNYLAADDDNGNLSDGTPHMQAIFNAFDRQEIACGTPSVADSGCAGTPATAPTVTSVATDRAVDLSWTAVAGANSYRVYRAEGVSGCNFGKALLTETTNLAFTDTELKNGMSYSYIVIPMGSSNSCFGPASSCSSATPTLGGNLWLDETSGALVFSSGDGDEFVDNCEQVTLSFDVLNVGTLAQTNVRIISVSSSSHPSINASISYPPQISSSLASSCASASGSFDFVASSLSYLDELVFSVEVTSDELSPSTRKAVFSISDTESDFQHLASKTFSFESDIEAWDVTSGDFSRTSHAPSGAGNSTDYSIDSSAAANNACDRIRSPSMKLSSTSTMSLWNQYDIEALSGGTWYDRANVAVAQSNGTRAVVEPDSGRLYNAVPGGPGNYTGCNDPEKGWADSSAGVWGTSAWSATALGSVALAGEIMQLEVTYATDGALAEGGFWFDEVTLTDVDFQVPDVQPDICFDPDLIFEDDFESGDVSNWSPVFP